METCDVSIQIETWLHRPLCRRYVAVVFTTTVCPVISRDGRRDQAIQWAQGHLRGGECEFLGAWNCEDAAAVISQEILIKLHTRGAEFIGFGVGPGLKGAEALLASVFLRAHGLESVEHELASTTALVPPRHRRAVSDGLRAAAEAESLEAGQSELARFQGSSLGERYPEVVQRWSEALARFEPIYSLNAQLRGLIRSADRTAADVRGRLARAIHRHGPFTDSGSALEFVAASLVRAEQRLDRERAAAEAAGEAGAATSRRAASMSGATGVPTLA